MGPFVSHRKSELVPRRGWDLEKWSLAQRLSGPWKSVRGRDQLHLQGIQVGFSVEMTHEEGFPEGQHGSTFETRDGHSTRGAAEQRHEGPPRFPVVWPLETHPPSPTSPIQPYSSPATPTSLLVLKLTLQVLPQGFCTSFPSPLSISSLLPHCSLATSSKMLLQLLSFFFLITFIGMWLIHYVVLVSAV